MIRFRGRAVTALVLLSAPLSACQVERTPAEYFDHRAPIENERESAAAEVQDRLLAFAQALNRGDTAEGLAALDPAADAFVLGPREDLILSGSEQITAVLERLASTPVAVEMSDVQVSVGPRANVAWFRATLHAPGRGPDGTLVRITGVYVRDAGFWKLVQAHLSQPLSSAPPPDPPSPLATAADSAASE